MDATLGRAVSSVFRPDIVHETYYSRLRNFNAAAKTVITVYDMTAELFPEYFPAYEETVNLRTAVFQRADHLICISESTRADLLKLYGIDPRKGRAIFLICRWSMGLQEFPRLA